MDFRFPEFELPQLNRNISEDEPKAHDMFLEETNPFGAFDEDLFNTDSPSNSRCNRQLSRSLPFLNTDLTIRTCAICLSTTNDNDYLSCGDSYCSYCVKLLLNNLIDNGRVYPEDLICPLCSNNVPDSDIQNFLGNLQFRKMIRLREQYKKDRLVASNKAIYCPMPDCAGYIHIINGKLAEACAICRVNLCTKCMKCTHPGVSCEEYTILTGNEEAQLEELMLSRSWKRCNRCSAMVERIDGCNFVKCESAVCRTSTAALCYLCGKTIVEKHHFDHYRVNGPFGETCNTMDGIEDTEITEEELVTRTEEED